MNSFFILPHVFMNIPKLKHTGINIPDDGALKNSVGDNHFFMV